MPGGLTSPVRFNRRLRYPLMIKSISMAIRQGKGQKSRTSGGGFAIKLAHDPYEPGPSPGTRQLRRQFCLDPPSILSAFDGSTLDEL